MQRQLAGVLLAAGSGSRFGSHKLLHRLPDGTPMAVAAARSLRPVCGELVAVLRAGDGVLAALLEAEGCRVVYCAQAQAGMGHSLAAAVLATAGAAGWLVALGDMPFIATASHQGVAQCLRDGASLAATAYRGQRGHPVGFSARWFSPLSVLTGDQGARTLLQENHQILTLCEVDDAGVLRDIDRPSDISY